MRITPASIVLVSSLALVFSGCGPGAEAPPPQAVMHGMGKAAPPHKGPWTKAEMIAVVQKSSASDDQKKAEIAKINAVGG